MAMTLSKAILTQHIHCLYSIFWLKCNFFTTFHDFHARPFAELTWSHIADISFLMLCNHFLLRVRLFTKEFRMLTECVALQGPVVIWRLNLIILQNHDDFFQTVECSQCYVIKFISINWHLGNRRFIWVIINNNKLEVRCACRSTVESLLTQSYGVSIQAIKCISDFIRLGYQIIWSLF